jgi:hypothetical protein
MVDMNGVRGITAARSVAECQRRPNHGIPIRKVFAPAYDTLRDTDTLLGVYVPAEREINQDANEKIKLYSLVR